MLTFFSHLLSFLAGALLVLLTLYSAIQTFVLPRAAPDQISRFVFLGMRRLLVLVQGRRPSFERQDRVMAFYAPFSLLTLLIVWLVLTLIGYMAMYWGLGAGSWEEDFRLSGSSLLTLGFQATGTTARTALAFSEAMLGLILVALLIAYLPTMYAAFSRREMAVTLLEVRAGSPPTAVEMILRFYRNHGLEKLGDQWRTWEAWFADIEESHTSLAALVFFRSPQPDHSWVTAAGAVLDAAGLALSTLAIPPDVQAALTIRSGTLSLRRISDFFNLPYNPDPHYPQEPVSITRAEYDAACQRLAHAGVPLQADLEAAWLSFAGWRVNYDYVLLALAGLTLAPYAPWSSDRAIHAPMPPLLKQAQRQSRRTRPPILGPEFRPPAPPLNSRPLSPHSLSSGSEGQSSPTPLPPREEEQG